MKNKLLLLLVIIPPLAWSFYAGAQGRRPAAQPASRPTAPAARTPTLNVRPAPQPAIKAPPRPIQLPANTIKPIVVPKTASPTVTLPPAPKPAPPKEITKLPTAGLVPGSTKAPVTTRKPPEDFNKWTNLPREQVTPRAKGREINTAQR